MKLTKIVAATLIAAMSPFAGAQDTASAPLTPNAEIREAGEALPMWRRFRLHCQAVNFANHVRRCGGVVYSIVPDGYGNWIVNYS